MILQTGRQTGYPSVDMPWLKYYREEDKPTDIGLETHETVWDVIEKKFEKDNDVPAIEYFGRIISRVEFRKMVYHWAGIFKNMGVLENEVVPVYGCLTPDIAAMTFALNLLGAVPYFLKLAISPEALAEETAESHVAVVFKGMWENVAEEFLKDKYKWILIYDITDSMKQPQRMLLSLAGILKKQPGIPQNARFISISKAQKDYFIQEKDENLKVKFVNDRSAFITSSSGTTIGGVVKGTVATNESTIAQLYMVSASGTLCQKWDRALNNFPPTASTSLNLLLFLPLFRGSTVIIDPRITPQDFYNEIFQYKPNFVLTTGSMWETFFDSVAKEIAKGKSYDFSYMKGWMVGGEGSEPQKYREWNKILRKCGAPNELLSGYGCSEVFSSICVDTLSARTNEDNTLPVMGVGIPFYGLTVGIFDKDGKELSYNQRGELWIKSKSAMQGYLRKPELTKKVIVDGWVHTGDLAQINEDGFLYIWGRLADCTNTPNGKIYNFDVAHMINSSELIQAAIVLPVKTENGITYLSAHIEWNNGLSNTDKSKELLRIHTMLKDKLPDSVKIYGYAEYDILPYSPTTLKKDKNKMSQKKSGYIVLT